MMRERDCWDSERAIEKTHTKRDEKWLQIFRNDYDDDDDDVDVMMDVRVKGWERGREERKPDLG